MLTATYKHIHTNMHIHIQKKTHKRTLRKPGSTCAFITHTHYHYISNSDVDLLKVSQLNNVITAKEPTGMESWLGKMESFACTKSLKNVKEEKKRKRLRISWPFRPSPKTLMKQMSCARARDVPQVTIIYHTQSAPIMGARPAPEYIGKLENCCGCWH